MKTVSHRTPDGRHLKVTVREATVGDGLRRANFMRAGVKAIAEERTDEAAMIDYILSDLLRLNTYPACMACSSDFSDDRHPDWELPLTFEQFLEVPGPFLKAWSIQVFEYNPDWKDDNVFPQVTPPPQRGKKRSSSTSD